MNSIKRYVFEWQQSSEVILFFSKDRQASERKTSEKMIELDVLAEKLGCTASQLSIAWSLKLETVQCQLISASNGENLRKSLQALQLLPRLSSAVMESIERILDNKPVRPPPISVRKSTHKTSFTSLSNSSHYLQMAFAYHY